MLARGRRLFIDTSTTSRTQESTGLRDPFGIEGERERLSFVDGEVPLYPLPRWVCADATWNDVLRVAIIRLDDLAQMSIEKADELDKPHLRDDAAGYEKEAQCLCDLRASG